MELLNKCRFCDITNEKYHYDEIDSPFLISNDFIAIASIGALIEGWSLIIPKKHQLSMKNVYNKPEFNDFMQLVIPLIRQHYGPLIAFEHGSNKEGSITACGTDHAHLHLVPYKKSLLPELQNSNLQWIRCKSSEISTKVKNQEYLFYTDIESQEEWKDPIGYLHILEYPISQFFRHVIAKQLGYIEISDYKKFPHVETSLQTRKILASSINN